MSKKVCVTGGTGYVAIELIKRLVEKGYQVKTTVRDPSNSERNKPLLAFGDNVSLHKANLLDEGSFDEIFSDVECVFHTASPFWVEVEDPQRDLIDPAVRGTKNVLSAVGKNKNVKVLVVTSSVAAVVQEVHDKDPNKIWNESDFNTTSTIESGPYRLSKYLAEKSVWDWSESHPEVRVCTINPTFVLGPVYGDSNGVSIASIKTALGNTDPDYAYSTACYGAVDNRNVADAHIACFEKEVKGRFIVSSLEGYTGLERANILREIFPEFKNIPTKQNGELEYRPKMSRTRAEKELGIKFYDLRDTLKVMGESAIKLGLVKAQ